MGKFHFLAGWVRGIILRLYYIYVCGDGQAAMWWWPLRLYCQLLGLGVNFSIPIPSPSHLTKISYQDNSHLHNKE